MMSTVINDLQNRRKKLAESMENNSVLVLLSGNPKQRTGDQDHEFVVWRNFYYLTHIDRPNFALVIVKTEVGIRELLFIDEVSAIEEKWTGHRLKKDVVSKISGINIGDIQGMPNLNKHLGSLMTQDNLTSIYCDLERISYNHLDSEQITFAKELSALYPSVNLINAYPLLAKMRQVKSKNEVENIKKAIEKTRIGIEAMMKVSKPGMYEYELEAYYDFNAKLGGVQEKAFNTIAAAGVNATVLHYHENNTKMQDGELILFDLGCAWNHYAADISRTFPVNGKFTPRQKEVYQAVLDVEKAVIEAVKPGIKMSELNKLAKDMLAKKCRGLGLITKDEDVVNYYYHSIGHSLGLDTHDVGGRDYELAPGMVITIEPGLYIEAEKIGVRIEDDILVTKTGHLNLSANIIKEVDEIEAFMKK